MADKREKLGCLLVVLAVLAIAVMAALTFLQASGVPTADGALSDRFAAAAQAPEGSVMRVADLTDYGWDRMHVFGPYSTPQDIYAELGVDWSSSAIDAIQDNDGVTLVVFVEGDAVVGHVLHSRRHGDLAELDEAGPFTPDTAVFEVRVEDQGEPWRVFRPADSQR